MVRATTVLGVAAGLATLGYGAARSGVARLARHPDPYPPEVIGADVVGDPVVVERPDGTRVHTVVAGQGPDVVLLHGYGTTMIEWNVVQAQLLERGHRVVCIDWRGHGGTTTGRDGITPEVVAADLIAVLTHHDVGDAVAVGHSTGGYLLIAALLGHPEVAERLRGHVLLASLAGDAAKENPQNALQIPLITSGVMQRVAATEVLGMPFAASIWGPDPSPAALRVFLDVFIQQDHQALVPLLERLATTGFYGRLDEISVPTVVIHGAQDATTPPWHQEALESGIPGARRVTVPNAGHMLNWQAPEVLVEAVRDLHDERG